MAVVTGRDIILLNDGQFAAAQQTLQAAFMDYPLMVYAAAGRPRSRGIRALYTAILRDSLRYGEVHASPGVEGVACWLPPGVPLPGLLREVRCGLLGLPLAFGWAPFRCLLEYGDSHTRLHHQHVSGPHWFLATIGVDPSSQGRGIGGALLEAVLMKADTQRLPCYLETHGERTVRLYERHGFETVELVNLPNHSVPVWAMLRRARGA
jgi:ribosomal protein S18 acetylase RimI-like enzyme